MNKRPGNESKTDLTNHKTATLDWLVKKGAERLRHADDFTRGFFGISLDAVVAFDKEGTITEANEQMVRLTGRDREELIGIPFCKCFADPDKAARAIRKTFAEGKVTGKELVLKSRPGKEVVVSYNAAVCKDEAGSIKGIFAVVRNITKRTQIKREVRDYIEQVERMVREAEERYERIFNNSKDMLYSASRDGKLIDVNQAGVDLLGYNTKEDLLAVKSVESLYLNPADRKEFQRTIEEDGFVKDYEITLKRKDGRPLYVIVTAYARDDHRGKVLGYEGIVRDITKKKSQEEQLQSFINAVRYCQDAIVATDLNFVVTSWNKGAEDIYGYSEEEAVGNAMEIIVPEQRLGDCKHLLTKLFDGQLLERYETVRQTKDGRLLNVELAATPIKDRHGKITGVLSVARPIKAAAKMCP